MNGYSAPRVNALSLVLPMIVLLAGCAGGDGLRKDSAPAPVATAESATSEFADASAIATTGADGSSTATTSAAAAQTAEAAAGVAPAPDDLLPEQAAANAQASGEASPTNPADAPTQAEQDFAAIYGTPQQPYDPVADPTLPAPADLPSSYDPWEKWNRKVHTFNNAVDRAIAKPLAKAYVAVVPRPVRLGVTNFFNNLGQPVTAVNSLLQGHPLRAGVTLGRFAVNSTIGVAGLFDPATRFKIPNRSEDFGQTLGVWGWKKSRYVELPLFGPRTVRDTFGLIGDAPMAPLQYVEEDKVRVFLQGLQLVDTRTQLMALDSLREGATDEYALFRDGWMQRRNYQINEDSRRSREENDQLPDYLRDDTDNPTVPVDVMPYVPGAPGG